MKKLIRPILIWLAILGYWEIAPLLSHAQVETIRGTAFETRLNEFAVELDDGQIAVIEPDGTSDWFGFLGQEVVLRDVTQAKELGTIRVSGFSELKLSASINASLAEAAARQAGSKSAGPKAVTSLAAFVEERLTETARENRNYDAVFGREDNARMLQNRLNEVTSAYEEAYRNNDAEDMMFISLAYADTLAALERIPGSPHRKKTVYDQDDSFPIYKLKQTAKQYTSVVSIEDGQGVEPHCTGFLIARNIVLTARHCLDDKDLEPSDLKVRFEFVLGAGGVFQTPRIQQVQDEYARVDGASEPYNDLIVLQLLPNGNSSSPLPQNPSSPLCFQTRPVKQNDAVYAFGHSDGKPLLFHSAGRVYLPHEVRAKDFSELRLLIQARETKERLKGLQPAAFMSQQRWNALFETQIILQAVTKTMTEFDALYVSHASNLASRIPSKRDHVYLMSAFERRPSIAIELDVTGGDSGAPVLSRETNNQCVVGMLVSGAENSVGVRVTTGRHERVVPTQALLKDLEETYGPDLKSLLTIK